MWCYANVIFIFILEFSNFSHLVSCFVFCYENQTQAINERALKQLNEYRARESLEPLALDDRLISDCVEWSRYLAKNHKTKNSPRNEDWFGEIVFDCEGVGPYDESRIPFTHLWYHLSLEKRGVPDNPYHLLEKDRKVVGCGICTADDKDTYITCRLPVASTILEFHRTTQSRVENISISSKLHTTIINPTLSKNHASTLSTIRISTTRSREGRNYYISTSSEKRAFTPASSSQRARSTLKSWNASSGINQGHHDHSALSISWTADHNHVRLIMADNKNRSIDEKNSSFAADSYRREHNSTYHNNYKSRRFKNALFCKILSLGFVIASLITLSLICISVGAIFVRKN